ncbi:MAG: pyruvate dehydrogenase complex dihydrolipoamide acetyltransferase [Bacteroidetes bacterium]|nr:pyruvate dehydrogenase complex dihydrolipoamide acetyltransferase [Bacteroidota bacterium]HET6243984.1 pyruvate dehydrogenase complex dihydrolipoamide acetyltransferase [Bacteroidia bacterium]
MAEIVRMPKLSDTMTEGVVAAWHKKVGDKVSSGDLLAEIETDKATMEFESFQEGFLLHQGIETGKSAPVDSILAILGEKNEDISQILKEEKSKQGPAKEEKLPEKKQVPEKKEQKQPEKEPEIKEVAQKDKSQGIIPVREHDSSDGRLKTSPLARKLAEDKGIDISNIRGSGDGGRIVRRDIENYIPGASFAGSASRQENFREEPVSQMRKTIARRLAESKFSAPHFYLTMEINMDKAIDARTAINEMSSVKISFNDLVVKAAAIALRKHPKVNSSWLGDKIRFNDHVHIGVAIAVEEGLLVPVVRFADTKPLAGIAEEVKSFSQKAKNKKLQPQDWEGNTFTISNLGMFGIEEFTAIINPPDACIMAVGGIKQTPVVIDGLIKIGNIMKVTLSCDHRVVDGVTGSEFLISFKKILENPFLMAVI